MTSSLSKDLASFKKRLQDQPTIQHKKIKIKQEDQEEPTTSKDQSSTNLKPTAPFLYSNTTTSLSSQLFEIIKVLKEKNKPLTNSEIIRWAAIDVEATPLLLARMKSNQRLTYDPLALTFQFKPRYHIQTPSALLALLQQNRGVCGMDVKELKESYEKITDVIDELEGNGSALVLRNGKDNAAKIVYYNDSVFNVPISDEFKKIWHETTISSSLLPSLPKELEKVNLKPMQIYIPKQTKSSSSSHSSKKKKRFSRIKVTNTHLGLKGTDLGKDYVPEDAAAADK